MTDERIGKLWKMANDTPDRFWQEHMHECLDEIVSLKAQVQDANRAIKALQKGRK